MVCRAAARHSNRIRTGTRNCLSRPSWRPP